MEEYIGTNVRRVGWGGPYDLIQDFVRAASHLYSDPYGFYYFVGFRVVEAPILS